MAKNKQDIFGDELGVQESQDFSTMFEASMGTPQSQIRNGDKVTGEVLLIGRDDISVSLEGLRDGFVPKNEFKNPDGTLSVQVGDKIDLYVVKVNDEIIILTRKPSAKALSETLEDAFDFGTPVEGRVEEAVNGGYRVKIMGKLAFCPISQMDLRPGLAAEDFLHKKFDFVITKFEGSGKNIVVSRRKYLEQQKEENLGEFLSANQEGAVVSGTVTRFEPFGAFVEIQPGVEGLLHVSQIGWTHLKHPSEALQIGDKVSAKILKIEDHGDRVRISLSRKALDGDPWENVHQLFREGIVVSGKVTKCMPFGAFVEIHPGIEGLIPLAEMSYQKRVVKSDDIVKPGDTVAVLVKQIQSENQRMTLSLRDADGDPWLLVGQKYPAGTKLEGRIERKENYGIFIQLEPGITGLFPRSRYQENPDVNYESKKIGDMLPVEVDVLDMVQRRISLRPPQDGSMENWTGFQQNKQSFGTFADLLKKGK